MKIKTKCYDYVYSVVEKQFGLVYYLPIEEGLMIYLIPINAIPTKAEAEIIAKYAHIQSKHLCMVGEDVTKIPIH